MRREAIPPRRGDAYGNRTRVTAVKGRCLSRLTNAPDMALQPYGSGDWIRTGDTSGMNRMLWPTELRRQIYQTGTPVRQELV